MANVRIKDLTTTAATTASDDFFGVDGATNGTRKLNAYSPTFGGNLTVSGTGTSSFAGQVSVSNNSSPRINFSDQGVRDWYVGAQTGSDRLVFGTSVTSSGGHAIRIDSSLNVTIPNGNLTVSGGTITSGSGTLTLNSSANTVVLQSAGTTALTLDSSQNATFAGKVTATRLIANSQWVAASAGTGALSATANAGVQLTGTGAVNDITLVNKNGDNVMVVPTGTTNATFAGAIAIGNTVNTVSPTSPNRTITMVIGGTTYYIHAKTTND